MRLTAVTNRLKKETTIQSISVTRPPLLSEETLAKEIFAKESLPSPSSFSSQSQHQVQVTLERGESRWLIAIYLWYLTTTISGMRDGHIVDELIPTKRVRVCCSRSSNFHGSGKNLNKKPLWIWKLEVDLWIWKLEVMSRTYVTKEENGSESLLQKKANQINFLIKRSQLHKLLFFWQYLAFQLKATPWVWFSWFKTFVLKF